jgi:homeobox-leucine zipper protein
MFVDLALAAMDELIKIAQVESPIWIKSLDGGKEVLNHEEYMRTFPPCIGMKPSNFVIEATRESGVVLANSLDLVETLMDVVCYLNLNAAMKFLMISLKHKRAIGI